MISLLVDSRAETLGDGDTEVSIVGGFTEKISPVWRKFPDKFDVDSVRWSTGAWLSVNLK